MEKRIIDRYRVHLGVERLRQFRRLPQGVKAGWAAVNPDQDRPGLELERFPDDQ